MRTLLRIMRDLYLISVLIWAIVECIVHFYHHQSDWLLYFILEWVVMTFMERPKVQVIVHRADEDEDYE